MTDEPMPAAAGFTPSLAAVLSQSERGNNLFVRDEDGALAFYADLGAGWWLEVHWLPGNWPGFDTCLSQTTEAEIVQRINANLGGWHARRCNLDGVALEVDGVGDGVVARTHEGEGAEEDL